MHIKTKKEDKFCLTIPSIKPGAEPPSRKVSSLSPENDSSTDLPYYISEKLLLSLVDDEIKFRNLDENWAERIWFPIGRIARGKKSRIVYAIIDDIVEARHLEKSNESFCELGANSWLHIKNELSKKSGRRILGWLHTHSVSAMMAKLKKTDVDVKSDSVQENEKQIGGLFTSYTDLEAARSSFGPPLITMVMDSDAAGSSKTRNSSLSDIFGVWGWRNCFLVRRNLHIIGTSNRKGD